MLRMFWSVEMPCPAERLTDICHAKLLRILFRILTCPSTHKISDVLLCVTITLSELLFSSIFYGIILKFHMILILSRELVTIEGTWIGE
jgi:hypothetical protein